MPDDQSQQRPPHASTSRSPRNRTTNEMWYIAEDGSIWCRNHSPSC